MPRVSSRELLKVKDHPEVEAAIKVLDGAADAAREAYRAWRDADHVMELRAAELDEVAARVLAERQQEG